MPHRTAMTSPALRRPAPGAAAVLAVAAALLTGCGNGGSSSDSASTPTSESAEATSENTSAAETSEGEPATAEAIAVTSVDFSYDLAEDSFAPGTYEVTLTNDGGATHDVVVERDGEDVGRSEQIGPGETSTFEVTLEEGEYIFYCSVGNHRAMGMEVPVTVTS